MHALQTFLERRTSHRSGRHRWEALAATAPWVLVLVITGLFQIFRDAPVDGAIFLVPAALLIVDAAGFLEPILRTLFFQPRQGVVLLVAAIAGILLIITPRHGWGDGIVLVFLGLFTLPTIWPNSYGYQEIDSANLFPAPSKVRAFRNAATAWGVVAVACAIRELVSFYAGMPSDAAAAKHPTISILFDPVLSNELGRGAFVAIWLIIGVTLLARGRHP